MMNSQNQEFPSIQAQLSLIGTNYCFLSISSYTFFQPKVGNRYILSFQPKVGNRYIYEDIFFCFHIFLLFFLLRSHLCWKSWSFYQQCHMPPISPFSQRNLYFGILGHSLKLFLGQICLCFGRRMVLAPTLNSNSFSFTASSTFCRHSLNVMRFCILPPDRKTHCLLIIFCFCNHQPFTAF